jgi:hypothetical protein
MSHALLDLIGTVLQDLQVRSWQEGARRDLGLTDDTDGEALLALALEKPGHKPKPLAFVIDAETAGNTIIAITEYLREALHPFTGSAHALAILDFHPPLDDEGKARGASRRWLIDKCNLNVVLPQLTHYLKTVAKGL